MNETILRGVLVLAGYLVGAIPFGWIIAKAKGVDILRQGSGNIGATNVGRVLGRPFFYLCFACDVLKGLLPTLAFGLFTGVADSQARTAADLWWWLAAMVAPVMGHMFSPYLGFRGGKGVATGLGSMLGVFPILTLPAAVGLGVYLLTVKATRYVGVSSCLAAVSLPASTAGLWLAGVPAWTAAWPAVVATALLAAVVVAKHRGNLSRTLRGTEPRAGDPIQAPPSETPTAGS
ncbi:MAG: glycerol-3-phosphate 1-O-acyltransferase PlsY [Planctomycetota bacterium]